MILAIDTATRWTGLALHDGMNVVAELGWYAINTQTIEVAPTVQDMLRRTDVAITDLDAIAVTIGPGSYTGLRVGLGLAKGLALAHGLPLLSISTLDVVAAGFGRSAHPLAIVCEAGRKRVCAATYQWQDDGWMMTTDPDIYEWETLIAQAAAHTCFAGELSPAAREQIRMADKQFHAVTPASGVRRAGYLAEIGYVRLRHGQIDAPDTLVPTYLRQPDGSKAK